MRAIQIVQHGGPEVVREVEVPEPSPGEGQAVVELDCAGVNYIDTYHRSGLYPVELPRVLGLEGVGTVVDVLGSSFIRKGQRVAFPSVPGAYAERVVCPADKLLPVPDDVPSEIACALMIQGMTAHYLAHDTWKLQPGQRCLIHAAAGGVGLLLVQIAKRCGAEVIGTVSTAEKADKARAAGADHIIRYTEQDFLEETLHATGGEGVQVVYDSVGASTFEKSLQCTAVRGLLVSFGQSSGPVGQFDPLLLGPKSLFLTRPKLFDYIAERDELLRRGEELFNWYASGALQVEIGARFPLAEAAEAHHALEGRKTSGKVVLTIG